jgi:hypothetical protein
MIYQYSPRMVRGFCFRRNIRENCAKDEGKVAAFPESVPYTKDAVQRRGQSDPRRPSSGKGKSMKKVSATLLLTALLLVGGGTAAHAAKSGNWPDSGTTSGSGNWPDSTYTAK